MVPKRSRKDDVRRWCLSCSDELGHLVARTCPSLEAARGRKRAARTIRRYEARACAAALDIERWEVAQIDVRCLARECWAALRAVFGDVSSRVTSKWPPLPDIRIRRRNLAQGVSGRASLRNGVSVTVGPHTRRWEIRGIILHELAHCARDIAPRRNRADGPHGVTFNRLMVLAAKRLWGVSVTVGPRGYATSHDLDAKLKALDELEDAWRQQLRPMDANATDKGDEQ